MKKKIIKIFLLLTVVAIFITNADALVCPDEDDSLYSAERKLQKALLCDYDPEVRPIKDSKAKMNVSIELMIKHIQTQEEQQSGETITIYTWMTMNWNDEYLVWDKSDHSNISITRIFSDKIWSPEIVVFNSDSSHIAGAYEFESDCLVMYKGWVMCLFHASFVASCEMDLVRWPYDTQNCSFNFKNLLFTGSSVELWPGLEGQEYILEYYKPNRYWQLETVNISKIPGDFPKISNPTLRYNLILKRHAASHSVLYTVPAIAMIALTVTAIMMKISTSQRIYLLAVNLVCHFLYLRILSYYVPSHGDQCPMVVLFYRDSLVVTAAVLISTAILKILIGRNTPVPKYIDNLLAIANSTPGQLVMYASDDAEDLDRIVSENSTGLAEKAEQRHLQDWKNFVKIVNRIFLLAVVITYLGLFVAMIVI